MKRFMCCAAFMCSLLIPTYSQADPQYDSSDWQVFMNGSSSSVPGGIPSGAGAVNGMPVVKTTAIIYEYIDRPIDMSQQKGIVFSDEAKENKWFYTSQTGKEFIEATVSEFHKLSPQTIDIPIRHLSFKTERYPFPRQIHSHP